MSLVFAPLLLVAFLGVFGPVIAGTYLAVKLSRRRVAPPPPYSS